MIDFDCFILYSDEQLITIASHILNGTIDQNMEHAKYLYHQIFGDDDFMVSALGFAVMGELRLRNVSGKGKHEQTSTWKMWFNTGQKMINAFKAAAV